MGNKKDNNVKNIDFKDAISERYLSYSLSTILSRSLPDVRDGLKPVHRRLLYAMIKLNLEPGSGYKKCARVVGDVIGKYHPHGDVAVYDTLVRLAQSFLLRYPLIDGQGNFGSIDGDNAAAMRYTESRMTDISTMLIKDIDKDTVNFHPTYDNSSFEPELMPASFPNLLANGSEGIAVGMATSIPPHNLHELCDALIYLIDNPGVNDIDKIMQFIQGPDFPTGGIIIDPKDVIINSYKTGKGSFKVRARWEKENLDHDLYQIIIKEIPYQVQKSKLIEQIANLLRDKKIPLIANIRDESTEEIRMVIEPKGKNHCPEIVMESLFKQTLLESRIYLNMNVISSNRMPKVMNILEVLQEFLSHRKVIVTRRSQFEIDKIENRLEVLEALKVAYLNIEDLISIIREDNNTKQEIIKKFKISDIQAEAILNIKLRSLKKLEEKQINIEYNKLSNKHKEYRQILDEPNRLWCLIQNEIKFLQKRFGMDTKLGKRKTSFEKTKTFLQTIDITAFLEKEAITIICSKMGWIRSINGWNLNMSQIKYKEGDEKLFYVETYTTDSIILCSSNGKFFTLLANSVPKGKGQGGSIRLIIDIENNDIVNILPYTKEQKILIAASNGKGFIINSKDLISRNKSGKQVMQIPSGHQCISCKNVSDNSDMVAVIGTNRKLLVFNINEIPEIKKGQGSVLQKYLDEHLNDIKTFNSNRGLSWLSGGKKYCKMKIFPWYGKRGSIGKNPPIGFPKSNRFD